MSLSVNIEKRLGNFQLKVKFEADDNVLSILGASGCGKSMTLKCIAGIEKPDKGSIVINAIKQVTGRHMDVVLIQRKQAFKAV